MTENGCRKVLGPTAPVSFQIISFSDSLGPLVQPFYNVEKVHVCMINILIKNIINDSRKSLVMKYNIEHFVSCQFYSNIKTM